MKAWSAKNREEIIKLQIRLSQLIASEERMQEELKKFKKENDDYIKENAKLEDENNKLQKEIHLTI